MSRSGHQNVVADTTAADDTTTAADIMMMIIGRKLYFLNAFNFALIIHGSAGRRLLHTLVILPFMRPSEENTFNFGNQAQR